MLRLYFLFGEPDHELVARQTQQDEVHAAGPIEDIPAAEEQQRRRGDDPRQLENAWGPPDSKDTPEAEEFEA